MSKSNRRNFIQRSLGGSLGLMLPSFPGSRLIASQDHRKFLQIFLAGGWDSALATDPIIGSKASSDAYQDMYASLPTATVSGKENLILGEGLIPAKSAFEATSTAFINGLFVEVTAHDLATRYMLTGKETLNRDATDPAFIATMGAASGGFPAHAVIGIIIPLGTTVFSAPPLQAVGLQGIQEVLKVPGWDHSQASIDAMFSGTQRLNELRYGTGQNSSAQIQWGQAMGRLPSLYSRGFGTSLAYTDQIRQDFNFNQGDELSPAGQLAGGFLALRSGLTRFVTVSTHGFDTHNGHYNTHLNLLSSVATALPKLIEQMRATPDPHDGTKSLMDTTTILITSEFVRTPLFNQFNGTDHWPSGSAILMGAGVRDNTVIGATDDQAEALGWEGGGTAPRNEQTELLPDHLAATIMNYFGFSTQAREVSERSIDDILG